MNNYMMFQKKANSDQARLTRVVISNTIMAWDILILKHYSLPAIQIEQGTLSFYLLNLATLLLPLKQSNPGHPGHLGKAEFKDTVRRPSKKLFPLPRPSPEAPWYVGAASFGQRSGPVQAKKATRQKALITSTTFKREHLLVLNPHMAWSQRGPDARVPSHSPPVTVETIQARHKQVTYSPAPLTLPSGAQKAVTGSRPLQKATGLSEWEVSLVTWTSPSGPLMLHVKED